MAFVEVPEWAEEDDSKYEAFLASVPLPEALQKKRDKKERKKRQRDAEEAEEPVKAPKVSEVTEKKADEEEEPVKKKKKKKRRRRKKKKVEAAVEKAEEVEKEEKTVKTRNRRNSKESMAEMTAKLQKKLVGARFRLLNEQLYTMESKDAVFLFEQSPELFDTYHTGFAEQVNKWPLNPLDEYVAFCRENPKLVVADMGCGEGCLEEEVENKVHSFDLVSAKDHVVACDMANTPLDDTSVDLVIFCLSLMGTNWEDFVREAYRILRDNGRLFISEVTSRIEDQDKFVRALRKLGFSLKSFDDSNTHFVSFRLSKRKEKPIGGSTGVSLGVCKYKKR